MYGHTSLNQLRMFVHRQLDSDSVDGLEPTNPKGGAYELALSLEVGPGNSNADRDDQLCHSCCKNGSGRNPGMESAPRRT
jgi:hypothetical protein